MAELRGADIVGGLLGGQRLGANQQALQRQNTLNQRQDAQAQGQFLYQAAAGLRQLPPEQRAVVYNQTLKPQADALGIDTSQFDPSGFTDQNLDQVLSSLAPMYGSQGEGYTLSEGQVRFGANNQPVAANIPGPSDEDVQPKIDRLRNQVSDYTKTYRTVEESFNRIKASADKPSAAGDLALIFNYMKMLDPASVVRESEFQVAAQAGDYGERIQGFVNRIANGQRLTDEIRKDFLNRSEQLFEAQRSATDNQIGNVLQLADQDKIDRQKILGEERLKEYEKRLEDRIPKGNTFTSSSGIQFTVE